MTLAGHEVQMGVAGEFLEFLWERMPRWRWRSVNTFSLEQIFSRKLSWIIMYFPAHSYFWFKHSW